VMPWPPSTQQTCCFPPQACAWTACLHLWGWTSFPLRHTWRARSLCSRSPRQIGSFSCASSLYALSARGTDRRSCWPALCCSTSSRVYSWVSAHDLNYSLRGSHLFAEGVSNVQQTSAGSVYFLWSGTMHKAVRGVRLLEESLTHR